MKNLLNGTTLICFLILLIVGCGGSGGGSGGTTGNTTGNPTTGTTGNPVGASANFGAQLKITGGQLAGTITRGQTGNVIVANAQGTNFTLPSVLQTESTTPGPNVVVIKAGTNLFTGTYTSKSATYTSVIDKSSVPIPLTPAGLVAQDTLVLSGGTILLPISKIGSFTFPNGIQVAIVGTFNVVQTDTVTVVGKAALATASTAASASGSMTFTGSGVPSGALGIYLAGTGSLSLGNGGGNSPLTLTGSATGTSTSFPTATVNFIYSD